MKAEARNPKPEARGAKSEIRNPNASVPSPVKSSTPAIRARSPGFGFRHSAFGFVSDFGIRISALFRLSLLPGLLAALSLTGVAEPPAAPLSLSLALHAEVPADSPGVSLAQLAAAPDGSVLPELRLLAAPRAGQPLTLTRAALQELLARATPACTVTNWSGAERVRITRRIRTLSEGDVKDLLTPALQDRCVQDRGELELRLSRPWVPVAVPDEPLTLRLMELPPSGISSLLLVRFELLSGTESVGNWQAVLQAKVWREIWVARTALRRGQVVSEADLTRERRDVLALREPLADPAATTATLELTEGLQAGAPLLQRHLRLQPVMRRGQSAEAILQDGAMNLVLKVEVLEDGAPGQLIRLRNPLSRRELRGKVQNEKTVLVCP